MLERISEDLCPPGGDRRIAILGRPMSRIYLEPMLLRRREGRLKEYRMKHRKTVPNDRSAKTEGIHKTRGEYRGVSGMAITEDPFESGDQLELKRIGKSILPDQLHFVFIK
jgi:hypothetical protein